MTRGSDRLLQAVICDAHVTKVEGGWVACVHLPGGYRTFVGVSGDVTVDEALDLAGKWVDGHLEQLLGGLGRPARRAYCLALGGGFDQ